MDALGDEIVMDHPTEWQPCIVCQKVAAGAIGCTTVHIACWNTQMLAMKAEGAAQDQARQAQLAPEPMPAPAITEDTEQPAAEPEETIAAENAAPAPEVQDEEDTSELVEAAKPERVSPQLPVFDASCAVLDLDGIHIPGQPVRELDALPANMGEVADLMGTLNLGTIVRKNKNRAGKWNFRALQGQLYITTEATMELLGIEELPKDRFDRVTFIKNHTTNHPFVTAAVQDGWSMSKDGKHLEGTTRMWRKDDSGRRAMITLIPMLGDDAYPAIADYKKDGKLKGPASADAVATRFQRFATALQYPYTV